MFSSFLFLTLLTFVVVVKYESHFRLWGFYCFIFCFNFNSFYKQFYFSSSYFIYNYVTYITNLIHLKKKSPSREQNSSHSYCKEQLTLILNKTEQFILNKALDLSITVHLKQNSLNRIVNLNATVHFEHNR